MPGLPPLPLVNPVAVDIGVRIYFSPHFFLILLGLCPEYIVGTDGNTNLAF